MTIGIEHKLKGYLSRIEKIKVDGTREVISADGTELFHRLT